MLEELGAWIAARSLLVDLDGSNLYRQSLCESWPDRGSSAVTISFIGSQATSISWSAMPLPAPLGACQRRGMAVGA